MTDATTANSPTNELSDDEVRKLLDWCREHAAEADALTTLNDMGPTLLRPSVAKDAIAVVNAILDELAKDAAPSAHVHAHMMILLSTLLDHRTQRDAVDAILLRWMRHPTSFGPARATPPELQKDGFVQRIADALGWGSLSLDADKDAIARLLSWVDTWAPKQKASAGRIVAMMRRNFPQGGEVWKLVRVEFNRDRERDKNHRGNDRGRDRDRDRRNNKERGPKAEATKPAEGAAAVEGAVVEGAAAVEGAAVSAEGVAAVAGATADGAKKKRRRRRRKRKPGDGTAANVAGAAGAEGAEGAADEGGDDGDDGDDGAEGDAPAASESAAPASESPAAAPEGTG